MRSGKVLESIERDILPLLPDMVRTSLARAGPRLLESVLEIRLRAERPVSVVLFDRDRFLRQDGSVTEEPSQGIVFREADRVRTLAAMTVSSVYAFEEDLRRGFITLRGGHRVGLSGRAVTDGGAVKTLKDISGFNIRIAREVPGCAERVLPYLVDGATGRVASTLVISPPRCGKTTLLRDLVRMISTGSRRHGLEGARVCLVDERSEVAACYLGVPQNDVGPRTDVLDACPKAEGMMMAIRSMSPEALATDEIGRAEDIAALEEAVWCGVSIIATAHASNLEELEKRPGFSRLSALGAFKRYVVLGTSLGVGTVESVIDASSRRVLAAGLPGHQGMGVPEAADTRPAAEAGRPSSERAGRVGAARIAARPSEAELAAKTSTGSAG